MSPTPNWYTKGEPEQMLEKKSSLRPGPFAQHLGHHPGTCRFDWTPVSSRTIKQRCAIKLFSCSAPHPSPQLTGKGNSFLLARSLDRDGTRAPIRF